MPTALNQEHALIEAYKKRPYLSVNAYLILRKDKDVLLLLRQNTGYCDGLYGLVSGHVEDGEPASFGMIREAFEEAGIYLEPKDLKVVHIMHRKSDRLNVDIFFECYSWQGQITNQEPDKCAALEFFSLDDLPSNTMGYVKDALEYAAEGKFYSEQGWDT